jgi:hypothetical protein
MGLGLSSLFNSGRLVRLGGATVAGTTAITTSSVDTQGFQSVAFVAQLGDVTDTCVLSMKAQGGSASDGSDAADIAGCTTGNKAAGATDADDKFVVLEVSRPSGSQRYVRAVLGRTTANAAIVAIFAVLLDPVNEPTPQPNVFLGKQVTPTA